MDEPNRPGGHSSMSTLDQEIAAIKSRIASRNVQIRSLVQLEMEQPHAKPEIISLRRKQRADHLHEVTHDEQLLSVMQDPAYADHVAAQKAATDKLFEEKRTAACDTVLEMEAAQPLAANVDSAFKVVLEALRGYKAGLLKDVEPKFHAALKDVPAPAGVSPQVRYSDACSMSVDRVRGNAWHYNFAFAVFAKEALKILGLAGNNSIAK